jgi:hypothetical protein
VFVPNPTSYRAGISRLGGNPFTLPSFLDLLVVFFNDPWRLSVLYPSLPLRPLSRSPSVPPNFPRHYPQLDSQPNLKVSPPVVTRPTPEIMPALGPLSLLLLVPAPPRQYLKTRVPPRAEHFRVQLAVQAQIFSAVHTPTGSYPLHHSFTLPTPFSSSFPLPMPLVVRLRLLRMFRHIYTTARPCTPHFRSSPCRKTPHMIRTDTLIHSLSLVTVLHAIPCKTARANYL